MAFFAGAFVILYLITRLIERAFGNKRDTVQSAAASSVLALLVATILGAYGLADGSSPVFATAFQAYLFPGLVIFGVEAARIAAKGRKQAGERKPLLLFVSLKAAIF